MLDYSFDVNFKSRGYSIICGIDEAGRGPLAGPVVAAACILPDGLIIEGLDDSKKLSEKKRSALYDVIIASSLSFGIGSAAPNEIDDINILEASLLAMRRAVSNLHVLPDLLLVDGNQKRGFDIQAEAVIKGDSKSQSIAAASILAKVTRDRIMCDLDLKYPAYGFAKHKGYPTKEHKLSVYLNGPSPCHRKSFLGFLTRDHDRLESFYREKSLSEM